MLTVINPYINYRIAIELKKLAQRAWKVMFPSK